MAPVVDDLYAGLTLPKNSKRDEAPAKDHARVDSDGNGADATGVEKKRARDVQQQNDAKRQKRADKPLDLQETVTKLKGYMLVDKKFTKASKLFGQLLSEKMTLETQHVFMDALHDMISEKGAVWSGKKEFEALIELLVAKQDVISNDWKNKVLDDWKLMGITHAQLFTDETYQFVKAAKVVKARLEALKRAASDEDANAQDYEIVMPLLRTLFAKHTRAWAKTMVETVLAVATQKRMIFNETHREEIDSWTKAIQDRRNAPAVARSAGSDARRNILDATSSEATIKQIPVARGAGYRYASVFSGRSSCPLICAPVIAERLLLCIVKSLEHQRTNMHAFRGGLSRALSSSVLGESRAGFASASSKNKPRMSWRQKQKIEEKKRNPKATQPRQPPREKVVRQNFLVTPAVDDGKKWRILSAGILERLPVIQPDLKDYEEDVEMMEHEIALREDQRLEDDFWFMEPGSRHITPEEAPWPNEPQDPEDLIGAGFQFAPRETEDDATNNRKSLNRALKGRVFLIVKNKAADAKFPWFFPVGEKHDDEKMRDAAVRHVAAHVGDDLEVTPVGFAPIGYVKYLHDANDESSEFDGTKVFFYKSQFLMGDVQLNDAKAEDYLWVTREELAEYLSGDVADYVKKIVPN